VISRLIEAADARRTILTPNAELAAALLDAVERTYRESGRDVWPTPRVRDFSGWLKERHVRAQLIDSATPRCLSEVEERELWRQAVLDSEAGAQFLEPSGAARAARRARRAMAEYGIPQRALAAHGTEESLALLDWSARFADRCRALHCIGGERLLEEAVELPLGAEAQPPLWIESPLWRPVAKTWLSRHLGPPLEPIAAAPATAARATARYLEADSPAAELAAIAGWAFAELKADPEFRAWVCMPDLTARRAELTDAFDAVLAPQRFSLDESPAGAPYAIAGGTPLAEYAPVRAALDFLSTADGAVSFGRFSSLLRSAELQASPAEAAAAARLDAALRRYAPSEAPLGEWLALSARAAPDFPVAALERLRAASRSLHAVEGHHAMSRWLPLWVEALEAGPWSLRERWSSAEYQSAQRFRELLATLALGDRIFGRHSRASADRILRRAARDTAYQEQTGIPPIWVSGQLADPWLAYQGLWITGCDAPRWPPPPTPIPLLPTVLQREYGVIAASAQAQRQFAADLQRRWCARAQRPVFSCADSSDGHRVSPSPLLRATGAPERSAAAPEPHWREALGCAPLLEALVDEQAPAFGAAEKTRGVASLRAQSRCAFRGFAQTRLTAEALERPLPGFNELERGELLHEALHRIWYDLKSSAGLVSRAARPAELAHLVEESARLALERLCERRNPGERWRTREQGRLAGLLHRWLELEIDRAPFAVERLEEGSERAHHAGLAFSVRVDRIDRLADGGRVLIDYKSGAADADWRGDRPDNPQLPLYALLHREHLVAVAYGRINAADCAFVVESERGDIFPGKRASRLEGVPSFADLIELWSKRIERLAADFARGHAAVAPTVRACRSCHLQGLCRVPSAFEAAP
jgi:ATP-dependent helicase/nuclease subunit B